MSGNYNEELERSRGNRTPRLSAGGIMLDIW